MFDPGHPGRAPLNAHAETGVRDTAISAKVKIPFENVLRQIVVFELLFEIFQRRRTLTATDYLAVAFRRKQVDPEGKFRAFHDALYARRVLGLRPAPEFEAWLERMGVFAPGGQARPLEAMPARFAHLLTHSAESP